MIDLRDTVNRLLGDMDTIRPIVIAAMPDDMELRATTRHIISALEAIKQAPAVPLSTYLWLSRLTAKLIDVEHGALLKPEADGRISETAQAHVSKHIEQRKMLLMQALQEIPPTQQIIDKSCARIGRKTDKAVTLLKRAQYMDKLLHEYIQYNAAFKGELQQLIAVFTPSMAAISNVLEQIGEESPELNQARKILEQKLPEDMEEARNQLLLARQNILQAGNTLTTASKKISTTIQQQLDKLSSLTTRLQQAESEARNDPLTGLPNRRRLTEFLTSVGTAGFCFLIIDIDFFKKVNDTYGHDIGDEVLQQLAERLKESVRDSDLVARIGGEEFCIVFPATTIDISVILGEKIRQSIASKAFHTQRGKLNITVSIGVSEHANKQTYGDTFKAADQALYRSKKHGRNQINQA